MIVTGENRWRASKIAGLATIPVKVVEIDKDERYYRQGVENWGRRNMTHMEWAKWFFNILNKLGWTPSRPGQLEERFHSEDKFVDQLCKKLGVSKDVIYDHLKLLEESDEMRKFLGENDGKYSLVREVNKARLQPEVKEKLKEKIMDHTLVDRETTNAIINSLRDHPDKEEQLLEETYTQLLGESLDVFFALETFFASFNV